MPINPELRKLTMTLSIPAGLVPRIDKLAAFRGRSAWCVHQLKLAIERAERTAEKKARRG